MTRDCHKKRHQTLLEGPGIPEGLIFPKLDIPGGIVVEGMTTEVGLFSFP